MVDIAAEIERLHAQIRALEQERFDAHRATLAKRNKVATVLRTLKKYGLEIADLQQDLGAVVESRLVRQKALPKYQNPADAAQVWSGRGKRPSWVRAHLTLGGTLEQLKIAA
ncbi:MAG: H-NS histone family protein [Cyanobacteria bacterium K_DeepCast_35m_m2_023]|nr:H-NS histone family protein [Cyanobacteria bacterium K_DeepCast_35m_m2_023]